jgi:Zn-dependent protease with chaperone function
MKLSLYRDSGRPLRTSAKLPVLLVSALLSASGAASPADDSLSPLRQQDERLLRIAEPIMASNVPLCDRTMPDLGVALQSTDQYPNDSRPPFAAPVAFAAVLPGSAAARAGIARDDGLVAIDGQAIARRADLKDSPLRDSALAMLAEHPAGTPLTVGIVHAGERRDVTLAFQQECRAQAEILSGNGTIARSDGRVIQISYGLAARATDDQLAAIFAHELAHSILHHRDRLSAADVKKGLLGEFGRNRRLNREAEVEADLLSVHLLANAGVDPRAAPSLWRSKLGRSLSGGIFHDRKHPSAEARAEALKAEIAQHLGPARPSYPAHLLDKRTQPLK